MSYLKLKSVCLIFENCDCAIIEAKDISSIDYQITKTTVSWQKHNTWVQRSQYSPYFRMILRDINDIKYVTNFTEINKEPEPLYDRIIYPDITSVELIFDDDTKEHFHIPFKHRDGFGFTSIYQTIKKLKRIEKEFPDIKSREYISHELCELDISQNHMIEKYLKWYFERAKHPYWWFKSIQRSINRMRVKISNFVYDLKQKRVGIRNVNKY